MVNLVINIDEDLKYKFRMLCLRQKTTMRDKIISMIENELKGARMAENLDLVKRNGKV